MSISIVKELPWRVRYFALPLSLLLAVASMRALSQFDGGFIDVYAEPLVSLRGLRLGKFVRFPFRNWTLTRYFFATAVMRVLNCARLEKPELQSTNQRRRSDNSCSGIQRVSTSVASALALSRVTIATPPISRRDHGKFLPPGPRRPQRRDLDHRR